MRQTRFCLRLPKRHLRQRRMIRLQSRRRLHQQKKSNRKSLHRRRKSLLRRRGDKGTRRCSLNPLDLLRLPTRSSVQTKQSLHQKQQLLRRRSRSDRMRSRRQRLLLRKPPRRRHHQRVHQCSRRRRLEQKFIDDASTMHGRLVLRIPMALPNPEHSTSTGLADLNFNERHRGSKQGTWVSNPDPVGWPRSEYDMEKSTAEQRANHGWVVIQSEVKSTKETCHRMAVEREFVIHMRHHIEVPHLDRTDNAIHVDYLLNYLRERKENFRERMPDIDAVLESGTSLLYFFTEQSHPTTPKPRVEYIPNRFGEILWIRAISGWTTNHIEPEYMTIAPLPNEIEHIWHGTGKKASEEYWKARSLRTTEDEEQFLRVLWTRWSQQATTSSSTTESNRTSTRRRRTSSRSTVSKPKGSTACSGSRPRMRSCALKTFR